jgi:DNA-binding NarL/FixJ family response regulator
MRSVAERVLIVDDHAGFRLLAQRMLERAGFDVVGGAADGESALAQIELLAPDVVLLDVQLPVLDGFEVAERLAERPHAPAVILTSSRDRDDYGARIIESRVAGFIPKAELSGDALRRLLTAR